MPGHGKLQAMLDSSSSGTSPATFVGDCRIITVSVQTLVAGASNITISLSNDPGFSAAIANWSVVTLLPARGIFTIDPGSRWIQAERASGSTATVYLNRYYE